MPRQSNNQPSTSKGLSQRKSGRLNTSQSQKSQKTANKTPASQNINEENIHDCVRYIVLNMGQDIPFKRADIIKNVFKEKPGKTFDVVLDKANEILQDIFGYKLEIIDTDTSTKKYIVTNILPHSELVQSTTKQNIKTTVKFLVLLHIFMSKNNATEASIWNFLKSFNIHSDSNIEDIGMINNYVTKTLVKQEYLKIEETTENDGEIQKSYAWGSHAEHTISKMDILKFVSKLYDKAPKSWSDQYKEAYQQNIDEVENMEVEDD